MGRSLYTLAFPESQLDKTPPVIVRRDTCCLNWVLGLQLANRRDQFDHIIIETTGLADPRPIISIFTATEMIEQLVLDGVVTLVVGLSRP